MSMNDPNPMEQVIETYAACVRDQHAAKHTWETAEAKFIDAQEARQEARREVRAYMNSGRIKPGVYRPHSSSGYRDGEGLVIDESHDYPDPLPMFR